MDRSKHSNLVDQVVEIFGKSEEFIMTITPEGTRSYSPKWKTGFYRIAKKANVPICENWIRLSFENGSCC